MSASDVAAHKMPHVALIVHRLDQHVLEAALLQDLHGGFFFDLLFTERRHTTRSALSGHRPVNPQFPQVGHYAEIADDTRKVTLSFAVGTQLSVPGTDNTIICPWDR